MDRSSAAERYGEMIVWEPAIQYVGQDFIQRGDTVFDVGGHVGGLATAFSRMVGPEGSIICFECNPEILPILKKTLELNDAANVTVIEKAAYGISGEAHSFNIDPSFFSAGSSLLNQTPGSKLVDVETITLDEIAEKLGKQPSFIKIDVEGAEFNVLSGAEGLLTSPKAPVVVLEYMYPLDPALCPLLLLEKHGYAFWDVNLYERVGREDYSGSNVMSNILAVPPRFKDFAYVRQSAGRQTGSLTAKLPAGRSSLEFELDGDPESLARVHVYRSDNTLLATVQGTVRQLRHHTNARFILELADAADVKIVIMRLNGPRPVCQLIGLDGPRPFCKGLEVVSILKKGHEPARAELV